MAESLSQNGGSVPDRRMNLDPAEIEKFEKLASSWWDPEGEFKPLHDLNPVRLDYIASRVPLEGTEVLDVGCGAGLLSEAMARGGALVTGVDAAEKALSIARLHALEHDVEVNYVSGTAESLVGQRQYPVVTCLELLEHVPDPDSTLRALAELVQPGGHLFLSTLNRTPKAFVLGIVAAEYLLGLLARGTHSYRRFIKPSEMVRSCRGAGLRLVDLSGLDYDPFAGKASLTEDLSINYIACFEKAASLDDS